jgi:2-oxoisovalerate dehydrogenase E1 component
MKGLMKAAYYDPNPVVILEHKGLYWSKVKGTDAAKVNEPSEDYILPFGKANIVQEIWKQEDETISVIAYGMGVHWALNASSEMKNSVEIIDLRTLFPLDEETIFKSVRKTKKCLVITEESVNNSFARGLAGLIQENCFKDLDAPVMVIGSENLPAIPLNTILEQTMIPNVEKVRRKMEELMNY